MDEGVRTLQAKLMALKQTAVKPCNCSLMDYISAGRMVHGYRAVMDNPVPSRGSAKLAGGGD